MIFPVQHCSTLLVLVKDWMGKWWAEQLCALSRLCRALSQTLSRDGWENHDNARLSQQSSGHTTRIQTYNTQLQAQRLQHSHTSVPHNIDRTKYIPTYIYIHTHYIYTCTHAYIHIWIYDGPCRAPCRASLVAKTRFCYILCRARGAPALLHTRRFWLTAIYTYMYMYICIYVYMYVYIENP